MIRDAATQARTLHEAWCRGTGIMLPYSWDREYAWGSWHQYVTEAIRFSESPSATSLEVLEAVIRRRRQISRDKPGMLRAWLRFDKITRSPDQCVEDWAEDLADNRPRVRYSQAKAEVLRATGRPAAPEPPAARPAAAVVDSMLAQLRAAAGTDKR